MPLFVDAWGLFIYVGHGAEPFLGSLAHRVITSATISASNPVLSAGRSGFLPMQTSLRALTGCQVALVVGRKNTGNETGTFVMSPHS